MRRSVSTGIAALLLAGCSLAPRYDRPASPTPSQWPVGAAYEPQQPGVAGLQWRALLASEDLQRTIERALANNRDLRVAVANVEIARAQARAQRSRQLPTLTASGSASAQRTLDDGQQREDYSASLGFASFELDLFGRMRNLSRQAFEEYLGTASGARSARLALVAQTADAYLTLAADRDLLALSNETVTSAEKSLTLVDTLRRAGLRNAGDVESARTILAQARADVESFTTQVAQDRNALELLVGGPVDDALLPAALSSYDTAVARAPAGLSSEILRERPDVLEAEHELKAAYAGVGAARAAFFPSITLTTAAGLASPALRTLTSSAAQSASGSISGSVPLLGGANRADLASARARQAAATARYEKAVQAAFRDVADSLAGQGTIRRQRAAQRDLIVAAERSLVLSDAQYRAGTQPFLTSLTAQRTLYAARQAEIRTLLQDLRGRVALYEALGIDPSL